MKFKRAQPHKKMMCLHHQCMWNHLLNGFDLTPLDLVALLIPLTRLSLPEARDDCAMTKSESKLTSKTSLGILSCRDKTTLLAYSAAKTKAS
mmetsp:Transcript_159745/g.294571  ORF Transcript_159745/g.294571 Transcript_159745/m.294571 type:complete len:92 (+) Transcript_159745:86-361(+)